MENAGVDFDGAGAENDCHLTVTMQHSPTAPPERDCSDMPPVVSDFGFALPESPAFGNIPGSYLPRPILPPIGHFNGASSTSTFTSWSSYPHPGPSPFSSHKVSNTGGVAVSHYGAMFPSLCDGDYNATAPYIHHPISDPTITSSRKRLREDDSNIPTKITVLASELPTSPDSYQILKSLSMQQDKVMVSLMSECEKMWKFFYPAETEMMVSQCGR